MRREHDDECFLGDFPIVLLSRTQPAVACRVHSAVDVPLLDWPRDGDSGAHDLLGMAVPRSRWKGRSRYFDRDGDPGGDVGLRLCDLVLAERIVTDQSIDAVVDLVVDRCHGDGSGSSVFQDRSR